MPWLNNSDVLRNLAEIETVAMSELANFQPDDLVFRMCGAPKTITTQEFRLRWWDALAAARKWIGDRVYNSMRSRSVLLKPPAWENSLRLNRHDLADDKSGECNAEIGKGLVASYPAWTRAELIAQIRRGLTEIGPEAVLGYDGVPYFSNSHPLDDGTLVDNMFALALTSTNIYTILAWFAALTDSSGELLRLKPDTFICGEAQRATKEALFDNPMVASGGVALPNPHYKRFANTYIDPAIPGNEYYIFITEHPSGMKPMANLQRQAPQILDNEVFDRPEIEIGVDFRGCYALKEWRLGAYSTG